MGALWGEFLTKFWILVKLATLYDIVLRPLSTFSFQIESKVRVIAGLLRSHLFSNKCHKLRPYHSEALSNNSNGSPWYNSKYPWTWRWTLFGTMFTYIENITPLTGGFYSDDVGYVGESCKKCPNGSFVHFDKALGTSKQDCKSCPEGNNQNIFSKPNAWLWLFKAP